MSESNAEIHALCVELLRLRKRREKIEGEETENWRRVYEIADDVAGEGQAYRYLDTEAEQVIGRSIAVSNSIDVAELQRLLTPEEWKLVTRTERVFDASLLEQAVADKKIDTTSVQQATKETRTARKLLAEPNKEERIAIQAAKTART